jgi:signal transduction histidine kinase
MERQGSGSFGRYGGTEDHYAGFVITQAIRSLWAEPRVADAPARVGRDWVVVACLAAFAALEILLRTDLTWRPAGLLQVAAVGAALMIRRTHPLTALALGFGVTIVVDVACVLLGVTAPVSPYSCALLLVLVYAAFRWGSGRDVVIGSVISLMAYAMGLVRDHTVLSESLIGFVLLTLPAVLGASVRFWTAGRAREIDQVRLREREQLARELHDTVAHHVSAMVIRAQAGRVVAETDPRAALDALEIIESEGSRTLAEMRAMVGALRDRDDVALAPQSGVADIERLARTLGDAPRIEVRTHGDLGALSPAADSALFRIAQESITNAVRHARHATRIDVVIEVASDDMRLTVSDDGDPVPASRTADGYGIVGMTERAHLLGGTLDVDPNPERGWTVTAVLPRGGAS